MRTIFLLVALCACPVAFASTQCDANANLLANLIAGKTPGPDGLIHVTYDLGQADLSTPSPHDVNRRNPPAPPQEVQALTDAVAEWNAYKSATGVVFDRVTTGLTDFSFSLDNDPKENSGCVATSLLYDTVSYSSVLETFMNGTGNLGHATTGFAHEIGHLLGLDDATTNDSIMTHATGSCSNPTITGAASVQASDATKAAQCLQQAKLLQNPPPPPPTYYDNPGGCVTYTYTTYWYYVYDDGSTELFDETLSSTSMC